MAACAMLRSGLGFFQSTLQLTKQACRSSLGVVEQVRGYYVDWRMLRDVKRRQMAYEFADTRLRINAIRKNTLLPKELQEVADKEIAALPRDSCPVRIRNSAVMDLTEQISGLENDLKEVTRLLELCESKRVQDVLLQEQKKIEKELTHKRLQREQQTKKDSGDKADTTVKGYTVKINNYGWDQSDKFVKIYITLKGVHKIPAENVVATFTERSFSILVKDLDEKNHQMTMNSLLCPIVVEESSRKVKTDMVLVMCKKRSTKKWECLTQVEKQTKEKDKPGYDENADPGEGLMNMLKKIYSEGDDEMKRTINKAWAESQEKKGKEDFDF
ncbi:hypothetical protein NFI96_032367 [Prochilodus magdalenae]|nr:hypothetical protein NFI96_032367 [Prochilodus magdalenae]